MFFTAIVVMIVTLVVLVFSPQQQLGFQDEADALKARANALNDHIQTLRGEYLPQTIFVAAYNSFYAMSEYIRLKGSYYSGVDASYNFNYTLKEMMINGTMCCDLSTKKPPADCDGETCPNCNSDNKNQIEDPTKHIPVDTCLDSTQMAGKSVTERLDQFEAVATNSLHIPTKFHKKFGEMRTLIFQSNATGPFQVGVNLTINYSASLGDMMVNNSENINSIFTIEGIPDPLYAISTERLYSNQFRKTDVTGWKITSFYRHVDQRLYAYNPNASSFLMRFQGIDKESECCGVESFINPFVMSTINDGPVPSATDVEKSYVDWCFFGDRCTLDEFGALWNVTCITHHDEFQKNSLKFYKFAIESQHAVYYNLTNQPDKYLAGAEQEPCPVPFP